MVDARLDALVRLLAAPGSRRDVLGALATAPLAGGLLALLSPEESEARGRRKRRVKRHKHGDGRRRKRKARKTRKSARTVPDQAQERPACVPEDVRKTCKDQCGSVRNNCRQVVECDPCCTSGLQPTEDLAEAIREAADGATLTLCPGTWDLPAALEVAKPLTLVGSGAGKTILDGGEQHRVMSINADVPVTLEALTIRNGADTFGGGAIYNRGKLTLIDAELTANKMTDGRGSGGGAILSYNDITLTNTAVWDNFCQASGGGIRMDSGILTLEAGSRIGKNISQGAGGGVYLYSGQMILRNGSLLDNNDSLSLGGGITAHYGDVRLESGSQVISNGGPNGAVLAAYGTATIQDDVVICGNNAPQCGGSISGTCPYSQDC